MTKLAMAQLVIGGLMVLIGVTWSLIENWRR